MQFKAFAFLTILSLLFFTACDDKNSEKNKLKEEKTELIKKDNFKLTTLNNQIINIQIKDRNLLFEEYKDKIILLNFFATWCEPCQAEIPHLNNLQKKYADKIAIIAVNLTQNDNKLIENEALVDFKNEYNINYSIVNTQDNLALSKHLGEIKMIPTMFLFDKNGKNIHKYTGIVPQEMLETDINFALGDK